MMTDIELEYADYLIDRLRKNPGIPDTTEWIYGDIPFEDKRLSEEEMMEIIYILDAHGWVNKYENTRMYSFETKILPKLKIHGSYSNYYKHIEKIAKRTEQKEILDYGISLFQSKTKLWPFFISLAGLVVSVLTYFTLSKQIREHTQKNTMPKTETTAIIDSVLNKTRSVGDSLLYISKPHDQ